MTKLEEVARAQYVANCWWRIVEDDDDGIGRYKAGHDGDRFRRVEWEQLGEDERKELLDAARAAVEALRVPNEAMVDAVPIEMTDAAAASSDGDSTEIWQAMIDAILKEKP
jgi:hypothetical protein